MKSILALVLLVSMCGCGPGFGDVQGLVTYDNKPLDFGSVTVVSSTGENFTAQIQAGGHYEIQGIPAGKATFLVYCQNPAVVKALKGSASEAFSEVKVEPKELEKPNLVPDKYSDPLQNLLTFEIQKGNNTINLKLDP